MAAKAKLSPEECLDIVRRRDAGESYSEIGRDLDYPHSTIARAYARTKPEVDAQQRTQAESREGRDDLWNRWTVSYAPDAGGPVYPEPAYAYAYLRNKRDGATSLGRRAAEIANADLVDFRLGRLTPQEGRAISAGRELYLYPHGFPDHVED